MKSVFLLILLCQWTVLSSVLADHDGDACLTDTDCQNGGTCIHPSADVTHSNDHLLSYCSCVSGFNGDHCEVVDNCSGTCQNGGVCSPIQDVTHAGDATYECDCSPAATSSRRFQGVHCEVEVQICPGDGGGTNTECLFGGTCIGSEFDGDESTYYCACPPTREGDQCQFIKSGTVSVTCPDQTTVCYNGGTCIGSEFDGDESTYYCDCPPSREGNQCQFIKSTVLSDGEGSSSGGGGGLSKAGQIGVSVTVVALVALILVGIVVRRAHTSKDPVIHRDIDSVILPAISPSSLMTSESHAATGAIPEQYPVADLTAANDDNEIPMKKGGEGEGEII